jgi:hypothetical protein
MSLRRDEPEGARSTAGLGEDRLLFFGGWSEKVYAW